MNNEYCYSDHKREESKRLPWNDVGVKKQQRLPRFCVLEVLLISWRFHSWPLSPPDRQKEEGGGNPSCGLGQAALARRGRVPVRLGSGKRLWVTSSDSEAAEVRPSAPPGTVPRKKPALTLVFSLQGNSCEGGSGAEELKQSLGSRWGLIYTDFQQ